VLNPAAWTNPPAGQFGTLAAYYDDYRKQRRPAENMNLGRTFRIAEKAAVNIRFELDNVFNRPVFNDPSNTNFQAPQTRLPNGNASSGFGYINTTTPIGGASVAGVVTVPGMRTACWWRDSRSKRIRRDSSAVNRSGLNRSSQDLGARWGLHRWILLGCDK
jgi:hypothetical protein